MLAIIRSFVVKYLSSAAEDEIKLLLQELATLPQFVPFANLVADVAAEVLAVVPPAAQEANTPAASS